jgi:tight adherence protein C
LEGIFFIASTFVFSVLVIVGILQLIYKKDIEVERRILTYYGPNILSSNHKRDKKSESKKDGLLFKRVIAPIMMKLRVELIKRMPKHSTRELEQRLRDAGRPFNWTPIDFRVVQITLAVGISSLLLFLFLPIADNKLNVVFFAITLGGIGAIYPSFYLDGKKKDRIKAVEKTMSDFFDMLNLTIEAGMGIDQALTKVCKQFKGPLSEEFMTTLEDMRLGKSRKEAFYELRSRVPSEQFQSIITSIIQAEQLGIGMGKVLKSLTKRIREFQREKAREKAMKAPVKMLFPMIFFIFPSLFIVILGPFAIYLFVNGL